MSDKIDSAKSGRTIFVRATVGVAATMRDQAGSTGTSHDGREFGKTHPPPATARLEDLFATRISARPNTFWSAGGISNRDVR